MEPRLAQDEPAFPDKERSCMKHVLTSLTAFVVFATGYSLHANWLSDAAPPVAEVRSAEADPFSSEAAFRHRHAQPNHWRAMLMRK
jgi:hypothetical protein